MKLNDYLTLGRSGLRVSPFSLGTMTFGTERGWGAAEADSRTMFRRYLDQGGNFIDTADIYTEGTAETMVGKFVAEAAARDRVVIATKYSISETPDNPNASGNGRKNLYRAVEGSLRRLGTDYIDLYWMHAWDTMTPLEEVLQSMNDLVRQGKIRHFGLSDVPAWYAARMHTIAEKDGKERPIALQLEYSLIERNIEREHIPAAQEMGWGLCAWSPLAGGLLSGKYVAGEAVDGRLVKTNRNPMMARDNTRADGIVAAVIQVAKDLGRKPAQIALAWAMSRPGVSSVILGATRLEQLDENIAALDIVIPEELRAKLDTATALDVFHPYDFFRGPKTAFTFGKNSIRRWMPV